MRKACDADLTRGKEHTKGEEPHKAQLLSSVN